jgi:hypothetical protein
MARLHVESGLGLQEEALIRVHTDHMVSPYLEDFKYRSFKTMEDLKSALIMYDARRKSELAKRNNTTDYKRKASVAFLEMEEEKANQVVEKKVKENEIQTFIAAITGALNPNKEKVNKMRPRKEVECYHCHKMGHYSDECWTNPNSKNYRGQGSNRGNNRGNNQSRRGGYQNGRGFRRGGNRGGDGTDHPIHHPEKIEDRLALLANPSMAKPEN